jgi:hypothetical protein
MLYEENPKFLTEVMNELVNEDLGERIGVRFRQQAYKGTSIPDGLILQPAFTIYIETKNWGWFDNPQLENHLKALNNESPGFKALLALAKFESDDRKMFTRIRQLCAKEYKDSIIFEEVSFENFVQALEHLLLPKNLADAVAEFRVYLDEQDLLPSWKRKLDVVNCARIPNDILLGNVYMCPMAGGAYSHLRCKYFGMYRNQTIEQIALIEAVVDIEAPNKAEVKWQNVPGPKEEFKKRAEAKLNKLRPSAFPTRVFLLGPLHATNCRRDRKGGMWGSKKYFDVSFLKVDEVEQLAAKLMNLSWSDFEAKS